MKNYKIKLVSLSFLFASASLFAQVENSGVDKKYSKEEIESIINQSIRILNYETGEKELVLEPLKLTRDDVVNKYLPPLQEAPVIYDMYIESKFNIVDAIRYTHMDILEIYKDYLLDSEEDKQTQ